MVTTKGKCTRCEGYGWDYEYDGVGGRWRGPCETCNSKGEVEVKVEINWDHVKSFLEWDGSLEDLKLRLLPGTRGQSLVPIPGLTGWKLLTHNSGRTVELVPNQTLGGYGESRREALLHLSERLRELATEIAGEAQRDA